MTEAEKLRASIGKTVAGMFKELGHVMPLLHWAMPSKYHSIHKNDLARAMVAQSEQAFLAIAQGSAPQKATVKILEYKEMEPFFVKGERGA